MKNLHFPSYAIGCVSTGLAALILLSIFHMMEIRDEQVRIAAEDYEQCVQREYGRSPMDMYQQVGFYPQCK